MASFHEVRFPASLALGALGGPQRRTEIITLANGREERNTPWSQSRRRWDAGVALKSLDDLHALVTFFEARMGPLHGFRWRDPIDHQSCAPSQTPQAGDQPLGVGDGSATSFPLIKRYASGGASTDRRITKPVAGSVRVAADGAPLSEGADFTVDVSTGQVAFISAPAVGVTLTAGFSFDTPVRFDVEQLDIAVEAFEAGEIPSIPVIEIIP